MMRVLGGLLVGASWSVLLINGLGMLVAGWLFHGYRKLDCHPMFCQIRGRLQHTDDLGLGTCDDRWTGTNAISASVDLRARFTALIGHERV